MTPKTVSGDCDNCESTFQIQYMQEFVSEEYPEHCPFCGEPIDELSEEYIEDDNSNDEEEFD
jgi:NAD-dependent SIR2 family protein deacetylase